MCIFVLFEQTLGIGPPCLENDGLVTLRYMEIEIAERVHKGSWRMVKVYDSGFKV